MAENTIKERFHITGMTCSACSSHVEKAVNKLEGVEQAGVNLLTETMEIVYDTSVLSEQDIIRAVEKAGYGASTLTVKSEESKPANRENTVTIAAKQETDQMKQRLCISLVFWIPLMYVAMYHMLQDWFKIPIPGFMLQLFHGWQNALTFALTQLLLLLPILYVNRKFFRVGFKTLGHLSPNMDSLVAVGATASVAYGVFALYRIGYGLGHGNVELVEKYTMDLYFESAGTILTLITVGKYLESKSKKKTGEAISKLMNLAPKTALILRENGEEEEIPTEEVRKGDIFLLKPGSSVPVDGIILEGHSSLEEAAITGESIPVEKQAGDTVIAATINKAGFLKCRAEKVGEDTTLAQIIRLVEEASASKAPIAALADKVAGIFVPVVMAIALLTFVIWLCLGAEVEFALSTAIAVLVISCPCALGLATPVAIMVGTGVGASNGILIKSGESLQRAKEVTTVVLDKTGTVTSGKLKVDGLYCYGYAWEGQTLTETPESMLSAAAALEKMSEHPLAEAVAKEAKILKLRLPKVEDFKAVFGKGVEGRLSEDILSEGKSGCFLAGSRIYVGNMAFLKEKEVSIPKLAEEGVAELAKEGVTPLIIGCDKVFVGAIAVKDEIRATSLTAIRKMKEMQLEVIMLTGDNRITAEAVRNELGIDKVVAEVKPQDKEREIRKLQAAGKVVAMIGDGINDAPALSAADVGMAIGAGTEIALDSADIVLMRSNLQDAVTAIALSRKVIRNIKQNLFWAFFYNTIGIPLAAGLWYPWLGIKLSPMFGAAAMSMSSLFVVSNALRLKAFKSPFGKARKAHREEELETESIENKTNQDIDEKENITMKKTLTIEGMMCAHCTGRVQKALAAVEGVAEVEMSLENKTAVVTLEKEVADETLTAAVVDAGYEVISVC